VLVQEGIPTGLQIQNQAAEPVIYLSGCELVGGFLRLNTERGAEDNLNAKGMSFKRLCMSDFESFLENKSVTPGTHELVYGTVARISALAAGLELQMHL
jgi:glutamate--cysteine ligase